MKLSKKLAVTTIAASVAMSAFAGIPLSNKGLAEKLGFDGVAYAATYNDFIAEANAIYGKLSAADLTAINNFRTEVKAALEADSTILDPFVSKLDSSVQTPVRELVSEILAIQIGSDWQSQYEALRTEYSPVLKAAYPTITTDALASVFLRMEVSVAGIVSNLSLSDLANTAAVKQQLKNAAQSAINSEPTIAALASTIDFTSEELADVYSAIQSNENVHFATALAAFNALNNAYKAAHPVYNGGTPGAPAPSPSVEVAELEKKLDALKDKLANATDEEKAKLIAEAVKETQAVVDKLSNLTNTVSIVNGKATLVLDENKALAAIEGIGKALNALKEISGEGLGKVKVTINLGNVTVGEVAIGLSDKIIKQAITSGLSAISLKVGDLTVDLPVGGTFSAAIDFSIKKSDATEETTGELKSASQVYDFNLSIGGQATTSFDQPIVIQIPLGNTEGLDTELLSVAKIVDGKLEFHGGRVEGNSIIESRDTFSSYVVVENKVSFDDVASVEAWAGRAIEVAAAKGAINGKAEGVFDPSAKVTRAEFAKMLVRALDLENGGAEEEFADVNASDWFAPYVAAAAQQGIINGRSATKFDPSANITRAEMATMIARALQAKGFEEVADVEGALEIFSDAGSISDALKAGVAFAASNGIVQGNNGKFAPNDNATRAQAAVIIYNALKA